MAAPSSEKIIDNNEIDLGAFFRVLRDGWKTVALITIIMVGLGLCYAFLKTPVYESSVRIIPADEAALAALNRFDSYQIKPVSAFYRFTERASSYQNFKAFVQDTKPALGEIDDLGDLFAQKISFVNNGQNDGGRLALSIHYEYLNTVAGPEILNRYASWTAEKVRHELVNNFIQTDNLRIEELENRRDLLQEKLVSAREARIFELDQAYKTANALGIVTPTSPREMNDASDNRQAQSVYADIQSNNWQLPLYFMGTDVIGAERKTLKDELEQGLSTEEIRSLTQEIKERKNTSGRYTALLREKDADKLQGIQAINIVDAAYKPIQPIAPRKKIILLQFIFMGLILGSVFVLFRRARKNQ